MRSLPLWMALLSWCQFAARLPAQDEDDEESAYRPGLIVRLQNLEGQAAESVVRLDESLSAIWSEQPPDPRLEPGPWSGNWQGYVWTQIPGEYRFAVYVAGDLTVRLGGKTVISVQSEDPGWFTTDVLDLPHDYHPIEVDYRHGKGAARLSLYWAGPQFQLEPLGPRYLFHAVEQTPSTSFERGERLTRALRCAACHEIPGESVPLAAPSLTRLAENLNPGWMVRWLMEPPADDRHTEAGTIPSQRRMPHVGLSEVQAHALAVYLMSLAPEQPAAPEPAPPPPSKSKATAKSKAKDQPPDKKQADPDSGKLLAHTVGCLACHQIGKLGTSSEFSGGDLTQVTQKRPSQFFLRWLQDPARINPRHRMPKVELTDEERLDLSAYLATCGEPIAASNLPVADTALVDQGRELYQQLRCAACHESAAGQTSDAPKKIRLTPNSDWGSACTDRPHFERSRPGYGLTAADRDAVRQYITTAHAPIGIEPPARSLARGLREHHCVNCHTRGLGQGIGDKLPAIVAAYPELAEQLPAMAPPSLTEIGDKLLDTALMAAIRRDGEPRRPWLRVRMPKYGLSDEELHGLVAGLAAADRIPPEAPFSPSLTAVSDDRAVEFAGSRLVTVDGLGCTSCHQIGRVPPAKAPLNALGPDLSGLGTRVRHEWFERWVRNPARIVPRMEMPSIQVPVRGVLGDDLNRQLAAVWTILNKPGFEPPAPNPIRVVRRSGEANDSERSVFLTDVVRRAKDPWIKPLIIGLPNRHNVLFDLANGGLAAWWIGDTARQRTEGKTWFWELGGDDLLQSGLAVESLQIESTDGLLTPRRVGQFITQFDEVRHDGAGLVFTHRLRFSGGDASPVRVTQGWQPWSEATGESGVRRVLTMEGVSVGNRGRLGITTSERARRGSLSADGREIRWTAPNPVAVRLRHPENARWEFEGDLLVARAAATNDRVVSWEVDYLTSLPVDQYVTAPAVPVKVEAVTLDVVPGYEGVRLPWRDSEMPTGLTWDSRGRLVMASLKGRVWLASDTDEDGLEDQMWAYSDELAAPYGVQASGNFVDVINKYALLRLFDDDDDGVADRTVTIASGWGHTIDYHDWAVGLERDNQGNYFIALPCEQDQRAPEAATLRGTVLRLEPKPASTDDPLVYRLQVISRGHRFPMGIARNPLGDLFVTDNQGNYNPFNELNHVVPGAHFGFINSLERKQPVPPLTSPAINLPHPWTRSVNGICFLVTPDALRGESGRGFGAHEGHLIGCEYDTRRLVRMSLQRVGDTYEGAVYPFSWDPPEGESLLGPLVGAVSPRGDLYVGSIRDSGWGAGNNIGEVVRLRPRPDQLPPGIAEVRSTVRGLAISFTRPVDLDRASDPKAFSVESYTRISTPAYGGPDQHRHSEKIRQVHMAPDGKSVELELGELRPGYVYEVRVRNLSSDSTFFPAEAHFTKGPR